MPSNRQGKEEIESVFQTPLCHILCDENAPNSARTVKLILRLWRAKLAFHPLSPKKKHCINAHYAETWGLFEIASLFVVFVCTLVCAPPPSAPLFPRLHSLFPRTPPPVPPLRACTCALPRALAHTRASADFRFLPSPFTALSQLTVYQHTRGEHLPHTIPFTFPSPSLSRFSPTGYGKVPLFPTLPPYFLATLPASPTAKSATEQVKAFSSKPSPLTL